MEISWNKAQELTDAIGEGAELKVNDAGVAFITLNRIAPERVADFDKVMEVATIYNRKYVSFEEAAQLFNEGCEFALYKGNFKGEWTDEGVYVISTFSHILYERTETGHERFISEEEFRALKPNAPMFRHYNWLHAQLFAKHNAGAEMPEELILRGKHYKPAKPENESDFKL